MTDAEFEKQLHDYLARFSEGQPAAVPLMLNDDGTIHREKTLGLVCYSGFELRERPEIGIADVK